MFGRSVIGGWRVGRVNWSRHEGVHSAACIVAGDELVVSLDPDELPVRIWIAGISRHVLLGSVRWPPALAASGPEDRVCGLDVFGCLERIGVEDAEILSQVDRQLGDRVAVVFDAFSE